MSNSINDGTYANLIAAVLRARDRTRCNNLAIAVRGRRAAVVVRVACADANGRPTTFSHYVTPFCHPDFLAMAEEQTDRLTADMLCGHLQVALSIARTPQRHTALTALVMDYARAWGGEVHA